MRVAANGVVLYPRSSVDLECWQTYDTCMQSIQDVAQGSMGYLQNTYAYLSSATSKFKDSCIVASEKIKISFDNRILPIVKRLIDPNASNFPIQDKLDLIGTFIEEKFAPLTRFNEWLDKNDEGQWYKQLAMFLLKLPLRAIRNIIMQLVNFIKGVFKFCVHPVTFVHDLIKSLRALACELMKPETWSKIGIGMIGAGLGNAAVTGNPLSVIVLGIGLAMVAAGLTTGSIHAARAVQREMRVQAVGQYLLGQAKQLPEAMLTGFLMGLIMGGIQRHIQKQQELEGYKKYELKLKEYEAYMKNAQSIHQDMRACFDQFIRDTNPSTYRNLYYFSRYNDYSHPLIKLENNLQQFLDNEFGKIIIRETGLSYEITGVNFFNFNPADPKIYGRISYLNPTWVNPSSSQCFAIPITKFLKSSILHPIPILGSAAASPTIGQIHAVIAPVGAVSPLTPRGNS